MPRIKSAIKRVEVAERNRQRNKSWKSAIRTTRTQVQEICVKGDSPATNASLSTAYSIIDRATSKGILHKKTAARRKSKLMQQVLKLQNKKSKTAK